MNKIKNKSFLKMLFYGFLIFILFIVIGGVTEKKTQEDEQRKVIEANLKKAQEAKVAAELLQLNLNYFIQNQDQVIGEARSEFEKGNFESVVFLSEKYSLAKNKELLELAKKADYEIGKVKTKEILEALKRIENNDYQKHVDLYQELVKYNPENKKYKEKLSFNTNKIQAQEEEKERYKQYVEDVKKTRENPADFLMVEKSSWTKVAFDTGAEVNITIKNNSPINLKDVVIRCDLYANSGTQLESIKKTIYEIIKAKSSRTFKGVSLGFINQNASKLGCRVIYAEET